MIIALDLFWILNVFYFKIYQSIIISGAQKSIENNPNK